MKFFFARFTVAVLLAWPMNLGMNDDVSDDSFEVVDSLPIVNMCLDFQLTIKHPLSMMEHSFLAQLVAENGDTVGALQRDNIENGRVRKDTALPSGVGRVVPAAETASGSVKAGEVRFIEYDGMHKTVKVNPFYNSRTRFEFFIFQLSGADKINHSFHPTLMLSCLIDMLHDNKQALCILRRDIMETLSHKLSSEVDLLRLHTKGKSHSGGLLHPALLSSEETRACLSHNNEIKYYCCFIIIIFIINIVIIILE